MTSILKADTIQDADGNNIINESGNTITIGASGDTISIPSGATIANSGTATGFGANTPAFEARLNADQTISDDTFIKISVNSEVFDTDNCYDDAVNYRFTPTVAGRYFIYWVVCGQANSANAHNSNGFIYFNGSQYNGASIVPNGNSSGGSTTATAIIDFNGSSDYVEFYVKQVGGTQSIGSDNYITFAEAYKIIE